MASFRVSGPARQDLEQILATSLQRWGEAARARYAALISAATRSVARAPEGPTTRDRAELAPGVRSVHLRHARRRSSVQAPVHVIFYRVAGTVIEIVRVLHERMEPTPHIAPTVPRTPRRRRR